METELNTICPVCGWDKNKLSGKSDFGVCPCCGFEYGLTDLERNCSFKKYRDKWIQRGYPFIYIKYKPKKWDGNMAKQQLKNIEKINFILHNKTLLKICPVCGWDKLSSPPYNVYGEPSYEICTCCGFEYGYTDGDLGFSFVDWRKKWEKDGFVFKYPTKYTPVDWGENRAKKQLINTKGLLYTPYL